MDILDILIAKRKSFTGETEALTRQAQAAMAKANEVAGIIEDAQSTLEAAIQTQEAAELANTYAQSVAEDLEEIKNDITTAATTAAQAAITEANTEAIQTANEAKLAVEEAVTAVAIEDNNTSTAKSKNLTTVKKGIQSIFNIFKNYTTTGMNEDGSMTQKAITEELSALDARISNIPTGGSSGSGNISGDITSEDAGSIVAVGDDGNIVPSSITEEDVVLTQIAAGTYINENIVGLEIDYINKSFRRLQGATNLNPGNDFDKFNSFGGRRRCIVDENGQIIRFVTNADTLETLTNKRIMVYQPAVYYLRIPVSVSQTVNGLKINKEQIYVADTKYAGFKLHPLFEDNNGNAIKYVLLPAYESGTLRANGNWVLDDAQDVNFNNDKLVSIVNAKPITGASQEFTYAAAERMAHNNGLGWELTDLRFESLQQILMMIEYGSMNLQSAFNPGITTLTTGRSLITGSTYFLNSVSGQALNTEGNTEAGKCAISYRGLENPYGNIWRFIGNIEITNENYQPIFNGENIGFKLPSTNNWVSAFGYDSNKDWIYLPIEVNNGASNSLPVGDYFYITTSSSPLGAIAGGAYNSQENSGLFYYSFDINKNTYHNRANSARIMHIPVANSTIENSNYQLWLQG